jgi:probable HAF family extracellular repeat protein
VSDRTRITGGRVDLGTPGGSVSRANSVNTAGLVTGYSTTADGRDHAFVWSAARGLVDLGTLGRGSSGEFVNDRNEVIGITGTKGNQGPTRSCGRRRRG